MMKEPINYKKVRTMIVRMKAENQLMRRMFVEADDKRVESYQELAALRRQNDGLRDMVSKLTLRNADLENVMGIIRATVKEELK